MVLTGNYPVFVFVLICIFYFLVWIFNFCLLRLRCGSTILLMYFVSFIRYIGIMYLKSDV